MPDPCSVVLFKVDLKSYHFGLAGALADKIGLLTDQTAKVRYGNNTWTGKVLVIRNLPPNNEHLFFLNTNIITGPTPPDNINVSLVSGKDGTLRLGPVLGILSHCTGKPARLFGEQTSFLKKLIRIGRSQNMLVYVFSPAEVNWQQGTISGYTLTGTGDDEIWLQTVYPFPDVIYDRGLFPPGEQRRAAAEVRKKLRTANDIKYFNPAFFGKWKTHRWFLEHSSLRLHLPETVLAESANDVCSMIESFPEIYIKPVGGSSGRGIIKISRLANGKYFYERRVKGRSQGLAVADNRELSAIIQPALSKRKHIVQQGIRLAKYKNRTFDVRVLMQKNGAGRWVLTGIAARVAGENAFITNVHAGGKAEKISTVLAAAFSYNNHLQNSILANLRRLALLACVWIEERTRLQFGEIAVDLGVAADGYVWFIELNAVPGRTVFRRIGASAIAARALCRPLEYARYLAGFNNAGLSK